MSRKTRILIVTDSAVLPTGMAEATRLIFGALLDAYPNDYELHQVGLFHCYAVTQPRWPIYPTAACKGPDGKLRFDPNDKYGQRTAPQQIRKLKPDIVFAFGEPQRVMHLCTPPESREHSVIAYVNFDGLPIPEGYGAQLANADLIITKSEFALNVLRSAVPGIPEQKLGYMYSPADIERFKPVTAEAREELRRNLLPDWMPKDSFVLGWIGRNQWRKQVWLLYKVIHYIRTGAYLICNRCGRVSLLDWNPSSQSHAASNGDCLESRPGYNFGECSHCGSPETQRAEPLKDVFLWLHMPEEPDQDWPTQDLERQFGLKRGRDIYYTEGIHAKAALSPGDMPALYNLWDAFLYLTGGEGFGIPAWESMCSGLPVIYTNYSSHAEFLRKANAGIPVGGILQPEKNSCIWRMIADVGQAVEAVRKLYFDRALRCKLGMNGVQFVTGYSPKSLADQWHVLIQQIESQRRIGTETEIGSGAKC